MSLPFRLYSPACVFGMHPVHRIDVYEHGVRTTHQAGHVPPYDYARAALQLRTGAVEPLRPPAPPALVRNHRDAA